MGWWLLIVTIALVVHMVKDYKEFKRIDGIHDAAHTDNRDAHGLGSMPDHTQGDRLDGRPRKASGNVGKLGSPGFQVHGHAGDGVDHR